MADPLPNPPSTRPRRKVVRPDEGQVRKVLRSLRYAMVKVFRIGDRPERVARGFAIGLVVNFFPTFGAGVIISGFLARVFGGHFLAGLLGGACLGWAWPFLFILNYKVGLWLMTRLPAGLPAEIPAEIPKKSLANAQALTLGSIVNSLVVGLVVYWILDYLMTNHRLRGLAWLRTWRMKRAAAKLQSQENSDSKTTVEKDP